MDTQKILIFIDWYLPGFNAGGPVRSMANMVDYLHNHFQIRIVTRNTDYQSEIPYENITPNTWTQLKNNVECCYLDKKNTTAECIKKIIREYTDHTIYINGMYSFFFSILPLYYAKKYAHNVIVAPRGMLAGSAIDIKKGKKSLFIKFSGLFKLYRNVVFHATNEHEANQVKQNISQKAHIKIAANLPRKAQEIIPAHSLKEKKTLKLVSVARISPEKNTLFALQMLNQTYKGSIYFDIYGSVYDNEYFAECKNLVLPENIHVNFKGSVHPEQTTNLYANADFLFLPSRGENFGHAILESFMAGTPVIISDQTPWKNLEEKDIGWDLPLNDKQMYRTILQKCMDMDGHEHGQMRKKALEFAKNYCENPGLLESTLKLFKP